MARKKVRLTIGDDATTAKDIEKMGAQHEAHSAREICVDRALRIVSAPAYMNAQSIAEASEGIDRLVKEVLAMA